MNTQARPTGADLEAWPALPLGAWRAIYATLHMRTQIVGEVQLALSPPVNKAEPQGAGTGGGASSAVGTRW